MRISLSEDDFRQIVKGHVITVAATGRDGHAKATHYVEICLQDIGYLNMIDAMRNAVYGIGDDNAGTDGRKNCPTPG
jgi:hypothetical protein